MSRAPLTIEPAPGYLSARVVVIDCPRGTTTLAFANGSAPDAVQLTDADAARIALLRHYGEERCRCTGHLFLKYGLAS